MISNGRSMKCGGSCENVCLQIGDYHLKSHMFAIDMGDCDIVLGADWLRTLGPIIMDFKATNINSKASWLVHLRSSVPIAWKICSKKVILVSLPNSMSYKPQRHPQCPKTSKPSSLNIKWYFPLPKNSLLPVVFMIIPFPLYPEAFLPIPSICHPFSQKNEIEKMVQELLTVGVIHPSASPYFSPVVMVMKKEGSWRMCPNFPALDKLNIKEKFPIPVIDDLLDELSGAQFFTKLDLRQATTRSV